MANKNIAFSATARRFQVQKSIWKPEEDEKLMCYHEVGNPYDMFSIKVCKPGEDSQIDGHLPMEINRITQFILQRCAIVSAIPIVRRGLKVLGQITVCMPGSVVNHQLLNRYETLLKNLYIEPKDK